MSLIDWFAARRKDQFVGKVSQDPEESDGLWVKCSECGQVAYRKDLISNFNVCSNCSHHNRINSDERINIIADKDSFKEFDESLSPTDPLKFKDRRSYSERIKESQQGTGLKDGVITGLCSVNSMPLALAVMDFRFMGGSMGSVVGEKITRIIETATIKNYPIFYELFAEKAFTWDRTGGEPIKQGNRNPLLYKNVGVDGVKTGYLAVEKYSLASTMKKKR